MVKYIFFSLFFLFSIVSNSQNIFFDEINLANNFRNNQLIDTNYKNTGSLIIRSTTTFQNYNTKKISLSYGYDFVNNSLLPQNWNDGLMFPSRGIQERHSFGIGIKLGLLDFNFQPEWIKVQNIPQEKYIGNPEDGNFMSKYFGSVANVIDNFRQFGKTKIDTFSFGQSRVGIRTKNILFGYSFENIWWGPGIRNSLIFTNNAGGFKHFYLNSNKPIKTNLGQFEFSLIKGTLDTNFYEDPDIPLMRSIWSGGIVNKNLDKRLIDAITMIYNPSLFPNLYIGFAYSRNYYQNQRNDYNQKYSFFSKDRIKQEIGSLFFRYKLPKDFSEFYAEVGIPNNSPYVWKFFQKNSKIGLVAGVTINTILNKSKNTFLRFNTEITQLQLYNPKDIFYPGWAFVGGQYNSWYTDFRIKQGYTNQGQLLGASIGPGSNMQSINLSFHKKFKLFGFQLERIEQNKDFFYIVYFNGKFGQANNNGIFQWGYYNKYWVDINSKFYTQFNILRNLMIGASFMKTFASNYRWLKFPEPGKKYDEGSNITDKENLQLQLSIKYLFNE